MSFHRFWLPLLYATLFSIGVAAFYFFYINWILQLRDPSDRMNPFLIKVCIFMAAFGPVFFILLTSGFFR